jgi:hypothetical protein
MIVNVRGTHGSGKSTIAKAVMSHYPSREPIFYPGRKQPWGYVCRSETVGVPDLWVPGHYEIPCGGCDTIGSVEDAYDSIRKHAIKGQNVFFEGILAQHYARLKVIDLHNTFPLVIFILEIADQECLDAVNVRRAERGKDNLTNSDTIFREARNVRSAAKALKMAGVDVRYLNRDMVLHYSLKELGWP